MANATIAWVNEMRLHPCIPLGSSPDVVSCLGRIALYTAKTLVPNLTFTASNAAGASFLWATQKLLQAPDWILNNAIFFTTGKDLNIRLYNVLATYIGTPLENGIKQIDSLATQILAPQTQSSSFKASAFFCPSLLLGLSAYKALENTLQAGYKGKQLLSGERIFTTRTVISADTSSEEKSEIEMVTQKTETTFSLLIDTLLSTTWTTVWGTIAYYTYEEMVNTLIFAGNNQAHSQVVVSALGVTSASIPCFIKLAQWIHTNKVQATEIPYSPTEEQENEPDISIENKKPDSSAEHLDPISKKEIPQPNHIPSATALNNEDKPKDSSLPQQEHDSSQNAEIPMKQENKKPPEITSPIREQSLIHSHTGKSSLTQGHNRIRFPLKRRKKG